MMGAVPMPRLFLIDSFGFIFRAYHARARSGAPPMRTSTGLATEAVFIFNNMLRKLARQYEPGYMAAGFGSLVADRAAPALVAVAGGSILDAVGGVAVGAVHAKYYRA